MVPPNAVRWMTRPLLPPPTAAFLGVLARLSGSGVLHRNTNAQKALRCHRTLSDLWCVAVDADNRPSDWDRQSELTFQSKRDAAVLFGYGLPSPEPRHAIAGPMLQQASIQSALALSLEPNAVPNPHSTQPRTWAGSAATWCP